MTDPYLPVNCIRASYLFGSENLHALMRVLHQPGARRLALAIEKEPYFHNGAPIFAAAHTGALGTKNGGMAQVARDWEQIASVLAAHN
jgi:hypothetical protein